MKDQLLINKIIQFMLAGNSRSDLISLVKIHSGKKLTNIEVDELIQRSKKVLHESTSTDRQQTVSVHVVLYESIYKYFHSIQHTTGINKSMQQKEKLVGMAGNGNRIVITRKTEINFHQNVHYDMQKLNVHQRDRAEKLMLKMHPKTIVVT